jgi:hypothetical protein
MKLPRLLALGFLLASALQAADAKKPNVLFIAIDDLRPDLGCYGNTVIKTPNFDRLAQRGMVFNRAYCQQAVCSPSRASIMTGKRPDATRVWDLETHFRVALPDVKTLGQYFKEHGYFSQGMGKIFHGGFDDEPTWSTPWMTPKAPTYAKDPTPADIVKEDAKGKGKGVAFEAGDVADDFYTDGKTARLAAQTIGELHKKGQPFFLAVGLSKPHLPFVSPKKYWDLYDPAKIPDTASPFPVGAPAYVGDSDSGEFRAYTNVPAKDKKLARTPLPPAFASQVRHGYYAAISYTDANLGVVLDALEKEGIADNTVIVLWGDHGWKLGDHEEWGKHTNFEVDTRVPLIFSYPGQKTVGQKSNSLVEFVDVYPTLVDLCGLPKADVDGVSLKPVLENPAVTVKPVAISQYPKSAGVTKKEGVKGTAKRDVMGYSIRDDRWRLTLWRSLADNTIVDTELYDEVNAPTEPENLAKKPENQEVIARLSKFLPPPIPAADPNAKKIAKGKKNIVDIAAKKNDEDATAPKIVAPADAAKDRGPMFDRRDINKDGKLSKEEFMDKQKDPAHAAENFTKFDKDKDGFLTKEEFVKMGK